MRYNQPFDSTDPTGNAPYVNGNPAASVPGSIPSAATFEQPQREIVRVITEAGLTPSADDLAQLLRAVRSGRLWSYDDTGTVNALVITPITAHVAPGKSLAFRVWVKFTNTSSNVSFTYGPNVGAVFRRDGSALLPGDLPADVPVDLVRSADGSFRLMSVGYAETVRRSGQDTIWIRADGDDANDGSANTTSRAVKTFVRAFAIAAALYFPGAGITLRMGVAGTYQFPSPAAVPVLSGPVTIVGDTAAQGSYVLSNSDLGSGAGNCVEAIGLQKFILQGLTVSNASTGSIAVAASDGGRVTLQNVTVLSAAGNGATLIYTNGGGITILAGCIANSDAGAAIGARGGNITIGLNVIFTISGNRAFSNAVVIFSDCAVITFRSGSSFTAGTITGKRFGGDSNAILRVPPLSTLTFVPGNADGTADNGARYIIGG